MVRTHCAAPRRPSRSRGWVSRMGPRRPGRPTAAGSPWAWSPAAGDGARLRRPSCPIARRSGSARSARGWRAWCAGSPRRSSIAVGAGKIIERARHDQRTIVCRLIGMNNHIHSARPCREPARPQSNEYRDDNIGEKDKSMHLPTLVRLHPRPIRPFWTVGPLHHRPTRQGAPQHT